MIRTRKKKLENSLKRIVSFAGEPTNSELEVIKMKRHDASAFGPLTIALKELTDFSVLSSEGRPDKSLTLLLLTFLAFTKVNKL